MTISLKGNISMVANLTGKITKPSKSLIVNKYKLIYDSKFADGETVTYNYQECYGCTIQDKITNDSTYYIDTGYKATNKTKVVIDCAVTSNYGFVYGSRTSSTSSDMHALVLRPPTSVYAQFGSDTTATTYNIEYNTRYKIAISRGGAYINDVLVKSYDDMVFTSDNSMYIFACNDSNTTGRMLIGDIYSFKIYEGDDLVRHMLPCTRNGDNAIGMIDVIGGSFYQMINREV